MSGGVGVRDTQTHLASMVIVTGKVMPFWTQKEDIT